MATGEAPETAPEMRCPACGGMYGDGLAFCPKDGAQLVAGDAPGGSPVGRVLADRYRIVRKLGEGGMGEVFEAQHIYIDKRFAIKTLRPEITSNPEAVARFHQEARSASMIGHENIVEIDDFGRLADGSVYLAMEYLEGMSLAERMRQVPPLSNAEALRYMTEVCRGLAAAHAKSIIHRDLKPENIYLAQKGGRTVAKVLDFGIAKVVGGVEQRLTQTGAIFGTPYYMSPEQALGHALDQRADIYSLGVILYEVFSGKLPFVGESFMGILSQHITKPPLPPSRVVGARPISRELEAVILKAMAKEPAGRYQSMDELLADLGRLPEGHVVATPSSLSSPLSTARAAGAGPAVEQRSAARKRSTQEVLFDAPDEDEATALELESPRGAMTTFDPTMAAAMRGASRSRHLGLAALGVLVACGGAVAAVLVLRAETPKPPATIASRVGPTPPGPLATPASTALAVPVKAVPEVRPGESEVVVDSIPGMAKIFAEGQVIGETPDVVRVPFGKVREVLVRKEGYIPKQLMLDPAHERKVILRLERDHHGSSSSSSSAAPAAPLPHLAAPPAPPEPVPPRIDPTPVKPPAPVFEPPPAYAPHPVVAPPPAGPTPGRPRPSGARPPRGSVVDPYTGSTGAPPAGHRTHAGEVIDPYDQ